VLAILVYRAGWHKSIRARASVFDVSRNTLSCRLEGIIHRANPMLHNCKLMVTENILIFSEFWI
jgi:hypothetical protein